MNHSIIIPVWNHAELTEGLLNGLMTSLGDGEVIVVNNGSTDRTGEVLAHFAQYLPLREIRFPENRGFPVACNEGLRLAAGYHLILLNNDVVVTSQTWVTELLAPVYADPRAIAGPTLFDRNPWTQLPDSSFVPYLEGWCLGFHRKALEDIGYLDEEFSPGSFEDVDFSERAVKAGYRLVWTPIGLAHLYNRTWGTLENGTEITFRNRRIWLERHGAFSR